MPSPRYVGTVSTIAPPRTRWTTSKRSHSSPALAWRNNTRSPTRRPKPRRAAASGPRPAPSSASSFRPAGHHRPRQPVTAGRAGRDVAAAQRRRDLRRRLAHDRQREERRGPRLERAVGVEQRRPEQPGAGRHLRHRRLGRRALDRAGTAAVDEPQRRDGAHRVDDLRAPARELASATAPARPAARAASAAAPAAGPRRPRSGPRRPSARRARPLAAPTTSRANAAT